MNHKSIYSTRTLPVLLKDPKILLIGGGNMAFQKAKVLKQNNIDFDIISLTISENIRSLNVQFQIKEIEKSDLQNYNFIIDATGNKNVSKILSVEKKERTILLNSVDNPEKCDFYFSSLLVYKNLKIAVSSDGASPLLTREIRDRIKGVIPERLGEYAEQKLNERSGKNYDAKKIKSEFTSLFGRVSIVGCGPGHPDFLTIKAKKIIEAADIILYDNLVGKEILNIPKLNAEKYCVGKLKGNHTYKQEKINKMMLDYAKSGYHVARLKGGDPYIFGRGAEEAEFLQAHCIKVEVVPGISSAFAAPLLAGIPPTHRELSSAVTIVTGCSNGNNINLGWMDFLKIERHTTIVLMGLTYVNKIFAEGVKRNVRKDLPVAIISNASNKDQKIITGTFTELLELGAKSIKPAVILFGEVVRIQNKLFKNLPMAELITAEIE